LSFADDNRLFLWCAYFPRYLWQTQGLPLDFVFLLTIPDEIAIILKNNFSPLKKYLNNSEKIFFRYFFNVF